MSTYILHVLSEYCIRDFKCWYRTIYTIIIQICHTWNSFSADVLHEQLIAFKVRGSLISQASCHPILLHKSHQKRKHEECACWGTPHFHCWWLGLHVRQCEMQCTLKQSNCIDNNSTALSNTTAIIMPTAVPSLVITRESNVLATPLRITWLDRVVYC